MSATRKGGLGRGLAALIPTGPPVDAEQKPATAPATASTATAPTTTAAPATPAPAKSAPSKPASGGQSKSAAARRARSEERRGGKEWRPGETGAHATTAS